MLKAAFGSLSAVPGGMSATRETPPSPAKQQVSWRPFPWPLQCQPLTRMSDHMICGGPWLHIQGEPGDRKSSDEAGATEQDDAAEQQKSSKDADRPVKENEKDEDGDKSRDVSELEQLRNVSLSLRKLVSEAEKERDDAKQAEQLAREATKKIEQDVDGWLQELVHFKELFEVSKRQEVSVQNKLDACREELRQSIVGQECGSFV